MSLCQCTPNNNLLSNLACPIHGTAQLADLLLPSIDAAAPAPPPVPPHPQSLPASAPEPAKARLAKGPDGRPLSPIMFEFCVDDAPPPAEPYPSMVTVDPVTPSIPAPTPAPAPAGQTKRNPVDFDYTTLYRPFLHAMAQIGHYGATKYGHGNWRLAPMINDQSHQNHLEGHLTQLTEGQPHDHFHTLRHQIAAIGFNAMMMFYWMERQELELEGQGQRQGVGVGVGQGVGVSVDDLKGAR